MIRYRATLTKNEVLPIRIMLIVIFNTDKEKS